MSTLHLKVETHLARPWPAWASSHAMKSDKNLINQLIETLNPELRKGLGLGLGTPFGTDLH